jgi:hypothetical protein
MKKLLPVLFLFVLSATAAFGQSAINATTEDGKKVILKADKTWDFLPTPKPLANAGSTAAASSCAVLTRRQTDRMSGLTSVIATRKIIVSSDGKTGFAIELMSSEDFIVVSISAVGTAGTGCIDKGSDIAVLFTDGTRLKLSNVEKFNCDGEATLYFGGVFGNLEAMDALSYKNIKALRVSTMKGFVEKDFTITNAVDFTGQLNCLISSIKK